MLMMMWGKNILLVELKICITTLESSMVIPKNTRNEIYFDVLHRSDLFLIWVRSNPNAVEMSFMKMVV